MDQHACLVPSKWLASELDRVAADIGPLFSRSEARLRARRYLAGLTSELRRKNAWQLAESVGDATPYGFQNLLGRARWSAAELRDYVRSYAVDALKSDGAILVLDETGFLKKGDQSAGVARMYSGTAGRIENCQIGVFLAYASPRGCALIDRELYLPVEWFQERKRIAQAGVPEDRAFMTKVELAERMLQRALDAQAPFRWVVGDEVYGTARLRRFLELQGKSYVLAVNRTLKIWRGVAQRSAERLADEISRSSWRTISLGNGSKGKRQYRFARLQVNHDLGPRRGRWLLVRESLADSRERSFYLASAPTRTSLAELAQVAGRRWSIEQAFEEAKNEVGLDEYEVRSFSGWERHIAFSMLAYAMLVVLRCRLAQEKPKKTNR